MNFPTMKRAHKLRRGDKIKVLLPAYEGGTRVIEGTVERIKNEPVLTWVVFDDERCVEMVRTTHVEVINDRG